MFKPTLLVVADFEGDFIERVKIGVPGITFLGDNVNHITDELASFVNRSRFIISAASPDVDTSSLFGDVIMRLEGIISESATFSDMQSSCLIGQIRDGLNQTALAGAGQAIEQVRRSVTRIARIIEFLKRFAESLDGFTAEDLSAECVRHFVELSFCGRCTGRLPPLCSNTCGAVIQGCFAGFLSGLRGEFNNLWGVVGNLTRDGRV